MNYVFLILFYYYVGYRYYLTKEIMFMIEIFNSGESLTCVLCGDDLLKLENKLINRCDFCGKTGKISHECKSMHMICEDCMRIPVTEYIEAACLNYKGIDPIELAVQIMNSPVIKMHGSEHHFIVPAVLLSCVHNLKKTEENLKDKLAKALDRALAETPNKCAYHGGSCGAAFGTGVFLSIYLGRELYDEDEWSVSTSIVADSLKKVAEHGGPRCCKRDTYFALMASAEFLRDKFAVVLPISEAKCTFSHRNHSCGKEECDFYNISYSLV